MHKPVGELVLKAQAGLVREIAVQEHRRHEVIAVFPARAVKAARVARSNLLVFVLVAENERADASLRLYLEREGDVLERRINALELGDHLTRFGFRQVGAQNEMRRPELGPGGPSLLGWGEGRRKRRAASKAAEQQAQKAQHENHSTHGSSYQEYSLQVRAGGICRCPVRCDMSIARDATSATLDPGADPFAPLP